MLTGVKDQPNVEAGGENSDLFRLFASFVARRTISRHSVSSARDDVMSVVSYAKCLVFRIANGLVFKSLIEGVGKLDILQLLQFRDEMTKFGFNQSRPAVGCQRTSSELIIVIAYHFSCSSLVRAAASTRK